MDLSTETDGSTVDFAESGIIGENSTSWIAGGSFAGAKLVDLYHLKMLP